jgi:hypothetical protein
MVSTRGVERLSDDDGRLVGGKGRREIGWNRRSRRQDGSRRGLVNGNHHASFWDQALADDRRRADDDGSRGHDAHDAAVRSVGKCGDDGGSVQGGGALDDVEGS